MKRWCRGSLGGWLMALAWSAIVAGCNGDNTGSSGPAGPPGPAGPSGDTAAPSLDITISGMTISGASVVDFTVTDDAGQPVTGLTTERLRFIVAKLLPGQNGDADAWQSYINRVEQPGVGPGTQPAIQATTENTGTLVDNGDGTYRYTFNTDITNVTEPLAVRYQPTLTHRVAIQVSGGGLPPANATFDFVPSGGVVTRERDIVATESCNECHGRLAVHGGARLETDYCVTCHNPGSTDANSGNTLDFKVMVHKIHRGEQLPSVEAGGSYVIYGFNDSLHDYSDVVYPQDIRNCTKCHDGSDPATPQGDNWKTHPTMQACTSCHDDTSFVSPPPPGMALHSGGPLPGNNGSCSGCHAPSGVAETSAVHQIFAEQQGERFAYSVERVQNTAPGQMPSVTFKVTRDGVPSDILNDPEWQVAAGGASRLAVIIGWDTTAYHNTGSGQVPAQPISINPLATGPTPATPNPDGSFTVTSPTPIPADAAGSGTAALEGHPALTNPDSEEVERIPVTNAVAYFPITDASAQPRRQVVDIDKCNQCHGQLSVHGNNRTDQPQVCVICHNANATDISERPATLTDAEGNFIDFSATGVDGEREQAIDFKTMIHAIHAGGSEHGFRQEGITVYGFGRNAHDFNDLRFPGILSDCSICHVDGSYQLPPPEGVLATTTQTADPSLTDVASIQAALADPGDDLNVSPMAATCAACHDRDSAQTHMEQNGAGFGVTQAAVDMGAVVEQCAICHGAGRVLDVKDVHNVR
jgi:OmcA/MtrC family decaheme c-type cytochrome